MSDYKDYFIRSNYMDEQNKRLQEQMKKEGKVKVSEGESKKFIQDKEIEKRLTNYFKRKYDSKDTFMFSHIRYKYEYFGIRTVLDLNNGGTTKEIQEDIIDSATAHIPILVPYIEDWDYLQFMILNNCLKVEDIIDLNSGNEETVKKDLISKIKNIMPKGVTIIDETELDSALKELGYTTYKFEFTNLGPLGDGRITTKLYGEVECDYTRYPKNNIDEKLSNKLEELYSQNRLEVKLKTYGKGTEEKPIHITDCHEEYTFEGKKYIRLLSKNSSDLKLSNGQKIEDGNPYWIEVEEIEKDEKVQEVHDVSELQSIISDRRQGKVSEVLTEFINEEKINKEKDENTQKDIL